MNVLPPVTLADSLSELGRTSYAAELTAPLTTYRAELVAVARSQ